VPALDPLHRLAREGIRSLVSGRWMNRIDAQHEVIDSPLPRHDHLAQERSRRGSRDGHQVDRRSGLGAPDNLDVRGAENNVVGSVAADLYGDRGWSDREGLELD